MAGTSIVQRALDNRWLSEPGVPDWVGQLFLRFRLPSLKEQWAQMHYGKPNPKFNPAAANLTGTA